MVGGGVFVWCWVGCAVAAWGLSGCVCGAWVCSRRGWWWVSLFWWRWPGFCGCGPGSGGWVCWGFCVRVGGRAFVVSPGARGGGVGSSCAWGGFFVARSSLWWGCSCFSGGCAAVAGWGSSLCGGAAWGGVGLCVVVCFSWGWALCAAASGRFAAGRAGAGLCGCRWWCRPWVGAGPGRRRAVGGSGSVGGGVARGGGVVFAVACWVWGAACFAACCCAWFFGWAGCGVLWVSRRVVFRLRLSGLLWGGARGVSGAIGAGVVGPWLGGGCCCAGGFLRRAVMSTG